MDKKISVAAFILVVFTVISTTMWGVNKSGNKIVNDTETPSKKTFVKLFPNPAINGVTTVSSLSINDELNFYVFDAEGTLLHQVVLKDTKPHKISDLKKGTYIYEVFKNSESIEQGNLLVK